MDFIEQLPPSLGFTAILVIIDRLSKQGVFIPTVDTITSAQLAELFVLHIFSKHGVPSHCTSDRGSEFVSHFFHSLGTVLDMQLHFTSGYYLQADGQTERVIPCSSLLASRGPPPQPVRDILPMCSPCLCLVCLCLVCLCLVFISSG
jgi:hypothetical protein